MRKGLKNKVRTKVLPFIEEDLLSFERWALEQGCKVIAGLDEAGRGSLAGPVVAGCVVMPLDITDLRVRDSKAMSPLQRELAFKQIISLAQDVSIGVVEPCYIDEKNILNATLLAMEKAVNGLKSRPDILLVDGRDKVPISLPQLTIVKGDARSLSIACASVVAKVYRDRIMSAYHREYPHYGFSRNKGYGTEKHLKAIQEWGPCILHRISFRGVHAG